MARVARNRADSFVSPAVSRWPGPPDLSASHNLRRPYGLTADPLDRNLRLSIPGVAQSRARIARRQGLGAAALSYLYHLR